MRIAGVYYDGRQARAHPVTLCVEDGKLVLQGREVVRREALQALTFPAPLGKSPRLILFADGGRCEVADRQGFAELLPNTGGSAATAIENSWIYALAALGLTLVLLAGAYFFGLPYLAREAAERVPDAVTAQMDARFFASLDQTLFKASTLPIQRQQAILSRWRQLSLPDGLGRTEGLEFRSAPELGANAFALPGGTIVLLDDLVALTDNDEDVIAVLAHEMGHVAEKHALRQMLQASVVGLVMAWYVGDVSNLLAAAPTLLLETHYSRDFERRADGFAADFLRRNGISPNRLADMLQKLVDAEQTRESRGSAKSAGSFEYLSSHPDTAERIARLRRDP